MRKSILPFSFLLTCLLSSLQAQNVSISPNGATPDASAMLDIQSTTMGLSIPNIALTATNSSSPIASTPKTGLIVYNTATAGSSPNNVTPGFYYWNGTKWIAFSGDGSNGWSTKGNAGTTAGTNFVGTSDPVDFVTKANNAEVMRVSSAGNVGIGNTAPASKLDVAAGTTVVNSVVNATGSINDFLQYNIQNTSTSTHAQSGYSSTADNGSATTGFAWMGINNSTFNFPTTYNIGGANDVSFLGSGQDMYLANANNTKSIIFSTGKATTPFFNERMRITNAGYVGIGTAAPAAPLDVAAGTTAVNTVINATGSINDFLQFNVQNTSASTHAQSGYSSTADNGTATTGFAWMGINNSTFNFPTTYNIGGANDVSFLGSGQDMYLANANNTKSIIFSTGTALTPFFNERMRITNAGNVGIGTNNPLSLLHLVGSLTTQALNNRGGIASLQASNGALEVFASTASPYGFGFQVRDVTANTAIPLLLEPAGGNVGIGTVTPNAPLQFANTIANRKIVLWETANNDHQIYGLGINGNILRYQVDGTSSNHVFYAATSSTTSAEIMRIQGNGNVGIGTSAPAYSLDVQATVSTSISGYGYLNSSGNTGYIGGSSGTNGFSARFSGRIICPEYEAQSDMRIKDIHGKSNAQHDLELLNAIQITDYEMKDKILWGNRKFKKIIAQELEKIYPQVVSLSTGVVPDIYQSACIISSAGEFTLRFETPLQLDCSRVKKIRIITPGGIRDLGFVSMPDSKTLVLKGDPIDLQGTEQVFVYGEEVNDFRVVDYEGLSTLNISATQQLYLLLQKQASEIALLKTENTTLKADINTQIQSLKAELDAYLHPLTQK